VGGIALAGGAVRRTSLVTGVVKICDSMPI